MIAFYSLVCVGLTLIVTMHQLSVTIRIITLDLKADEAESKNRKMRILVVIWGAAYALLLYYFDSYESDKFSLVAMLQMFLMIGVYVFIIITLNRNMR